MNDLQRVRKMADCPEQMDAHFKKLASILNILLGLVLYMYCFFYILQYYDEYELYRDLSVQIILFFTSFILRIHSFLTKRKKEH